MMKTIMPVRWITILIFLFPLLAAFVATDCSTNKPCPVCPPTQTDTTSHNFLWTRYVIGDASGGGSQFNDVAIINDTLAIAVGDFYRNDTEFNAAIWNGLEWTPKRITVNFRGNMVTLPLQGIFAFSATDIWLVGSLPIHGDGQNWNIYDLRSMSGLESISLSKAWGSNSSDMYFVGNAGSIVHYNGTSWSKIESGTTLPINDIWGDYNCKTGQYEILCVASDILESLNKEIIRINGTTAQIISKDGIGGVLSSVWFKAGSKYYVAGGGGVYEKNNLGDTSWVKSQYDFTKNFIDHLRGVGSNDIAAAGGYGDVLHFNGANWKSYFDETKLTYGNYYSVDIKNNLIVTVGQDNPNAVILMGRR
jgi:hypothetical protein